MKRKPERIKAVVETLSKRDRRKTHLEKSLGERVKQLRTNVGLTQFELGNASNLSTSYISRLESGEVNPTVDSLQAIVKVFGITIDQILDLTQPNEHLISVEGLDPEVLNALVKLRNHNLSVTTKNFLSFLVEEELKKPYEA